MTVGSAKAISVKLLSAVGINTALLDAQLLLGHVLDMSPLEVQLNSASQLKSFEVKQFFKLLRRRLCFEPIAYILGTKEFFGIEFLVTKECLIPRPDTECVVLKCLDLIATKKNDLIFDLCVGSGAIAIAILKHRPALKAIVSDLSSKALDIAKKNAENQCVIDRMDFLCGDLFRPFCAKKKAVLIVVNPPYIGASSIKNLSPSVRDYEPRIALDAGDELGLAFYRRILRTAPFYLKENGYLVLEIGFDQKEQIEKLIDDSFLKIEFFKDLAGRDRGIVLQKK